MQGGEASTGECRGGGCGDPASEYGGLVLGADRAPVGFPLVQEPGGAAQGLHVCVHLQGINLPGGKEGGGTRGVA